MGSEQITAANVRGAAEVPRDAGSTRTEIDVLAVIDHLALGGAEMLLGQFAAAAPRAGIRFHVAHLEDHDGSPAGEPLRAAGIEPASLKLSGRPGVRHLRAMRRHIRAVGPDVVHTHLGSADLIGGIASRSLGIPAVSTIHEVVQRRAGVERAKDMVFMFSQRCCDARVITVSDSARQAYIEQSRGMSDRVVLIPNGIDVAVAPGSGAAVRRELGVGADELLVGMVSALRAEKGHDAAIEAFARLRERFPRLRLLIAGQGRRAGELARLAAPFGDAILLAGRRTDVARVFDALDVCLHPSRLDAFPTTLIEALAASVPVLATAVGGIPEIIDDGRTGVLVPGPPDPDVLAAALGELLADPARRRALADAGRRAYLERFTTGPWVQRTRALYDAVLAEAGARRNYVRGRSWR
jgi:glycosyltransferase involved in cell wall biosynthesis